MKKPRRHFPATEKVAILKRHLIEKAAVSDLCNELDISPTLFYGWLKAAFRAARPASVTEVSRRQSVLSRFSPASAVSPASVISGPLTARSSSEGDLARARSASSPKRGTPTSSSFISRGMPASWRKPAAETTVSCRSSHSSPPSRATSARPASPTRVSSRRRKRRCLSPIKWRRPGPEPWKLLDMVQAGVADRRTAQIEPGEPLKRGERLQSGVRKIAVAEIELAKGRDACQVFHARIGDAASTQIHTRPHRLVAAGNSVAELLA